MPPCAILTPMSTSLTLVSGHAPARHTDTHVNATDTDVTGYKNTQNDNYSQRAKVYCYLKEARNNGEECALGLSELKTLAGKWFENKDKGNEEPEADNGASKGKRRKRAAWSDVASEMAKHAAEGPAVEI